MLKYRTWSSLSLQMTLLERRVGWEFQTGINAGQRPGEKTIIEMDHGEGPPFCGHDQIRVMVHWGWGDEAGRNFWGLAHWKKTQHQTVLVSIHVPCKDFQPVHPCSECSNPLGSLYSVDVIQDLECKTNKKKVSFLSVLLPIQPTSASVHFHLLLYLSAVTSGLLITLLSHHCFSSCLQQLSFQAPCLHSLQSIFHRAITVILLKLTSDHISSLLNPSTSYPWLLDYNPSSLQ